jgi:hypothetical protein
MFISKRFRIIDLDYGLNAERTEMHQRSCNIDRKRCARSAKR